MINRYLGHHLHMLHVCMLIAKNGVSYRKKLCLYMSPDSHMKLDYNAMGDNLRINNSLNSKNHIMTLPN